MRRNRGRYRLVLEVSSFHASLPKAWSITAKVIQMSTNGNKLYLHVNVDNSRL